MKKVTEKVSIIKVQLCSFCVVLVDSVTIIVFFFNLVRAMFLKPLCRNDLLKRTKLSHNLNLVVKEIKKTLTTFVFESVFTTAVGRSNNK